MRLSDVALRRWAWGVAGFYATVMVVAVTVVGIDYAVAENRDVSVRPMDVFFLLMITLFPLVGLLITHRQPRNRIGWVMLAIGFFWAVSALAEFYVRWALVLHPGSLPGGYVVYAYAAAGWLPPIVLMGVFLTLLFPTGRPLSPRWRWVAWLGVGIIVVGTLSITFAPGPLDGELPAVDRDNPLGIDALGPALDVLATACAALIPVGMLAATWSLVLRFRRSAGVERLQLKWLTTAGAFTASCFALGILASVPHQSQVEGTSLYTVVDVLETISVLSFGLIPISIGIAITRYGLYGIDAIISRALVFGALGVFITGVYVAIVVGVGAAIGQSHPSVALSVVATAVVAVAFQPVREWLQGLANRLVYGSRATPYEVLSDFATRLAGTYTTAELLPRMAQTVSECLGGARVEVWLRSGGQLVREVAWPENSVATAGPVSIAGDDLPSLDADRVVPVSHHDELLGMLAITKQASEPVTPAEDAMLGHVASQAGLVLRNVRLIDDLRSSRERLVATQDDERRRLERNLHDGAQQSLVSVALLTRMAAARASDEELRASLGEASAQLQQAIEELRELARGIHPAILTERGLGPALTSLAERSPVPVHVRNGTDGRLPSTVEGTLYFVVAEALANVVKYANATSVTVTLDQEGEGAVLVVADDGVGGADPSRGTGLRGLADRLAVVDGSLVLDSAPGAGTRITCRVPVAAARGAVLEPAT